MNMPKRQGAFPAQTIRSLMEANYLSKGLEENIKPASLDLTLSEEIYRVGVAFLPRPDQTIREIVGNLKPHHHDYSSPLERDVVYLARLNEAVSLPNGVYGYCNPKSSSGRNDTLVRVTTDYTSRYDSIPGGHHGELWLLITPKSFPIQLAPGQTLAQARFFDADTRFGETDLALAMDQHGLLWRKNGTRIKYDEITTSDHDGSVLLGIDLDGNDVIGWECLGIDTVLSFANLLHYRPLDFFRPVTRKNGYVHLRGGGFYIFYTKERVRVPPHLACEMRPMEARNGEFRSHYAGFIDPGWGWGENGEGIGRRLVLEIRPYEDLVFWDGQPAAKIRFESVLETPEFTYDTAACGSNYTVEPPAPLLSKQFVRE
jgi:dCTP deaminase